MESKEQLQKRLNPRRKRRALSKATAAKLDAQKKTKKAKTSD